MKIRTFEDFQDAIDAETGWRKRELTAIKANVTEARKFSKDTAMRSGIALLYAHWEGAVKNIASAYLEYVSNLGLPYCKLKTNFLAISVKDNLRLFTDTNKATLHTMLLNEMFEKYEQKSRIPQNGIIKTGSNLNSEVFKEIMACIGLDCAKYEVYYNFIDEVLLNMRNKIAHGERLEAISLDEQRYYRIHQKVFDLIMMFADHVLNAAVLKDYMDTPKKIC